MSLSAAPPLESPQHVVGHFSTLLVDQKRGDRMLGVDLWYPAVAPTEATTYDLIPGIGFTAACAQEAALTGHLLISTLHTNDAPSTIARLTDMGIEPFMISSSLLCVCAQRLMRRVCKTCKIQTDPTPREKELLEKALGWSGPIHKAAPKGCPKCGNSGYKGRVGIHELMITTEELIEGINKGMETSELKKIAMRGGMKTLHQDSLLKVKDGLTTMEEAIANVPPDL